MNTNKIKEFLTDEHFKISETFGIYNIANYDSLKKGNLLKIEDSKSIEEIINISEKFINEGKVVLEALDEFVDEYFKAKVPEEYLQTNLLKVFWEPFEEFFDKYHDTIQNNMDAIPIEQLEYIVYKLDDDMLKISGEFLRITRKFSNSFCGAAK